MDLKNYGIYETLSYWPALDLLLHGVSIKTWNPIDLKSALLKPSDIASKLVKVKIRILKLEDFHGDTLNQFYDYDLIKAVKQFQYRNRLNAKGLLNRETVKAIYVP